MDGKVLIIHDFTKHASSNTHEQWRERGKAIANICCILILQNIGYMGVARIFERGAPTSRDKVDVTWQWWRHTDHSLFVPAFNYVIRMLKILCVYFRTLWRVLNFFNSENFPNYGVCRKQETHDPKVQLHYRQDPLDISSTTPSLVSAVFRWKRSVILLFAVGGSAVDGLRCRLDNAYAKSAGILHLIQ